MIIKKIYIYKYVQHNGGNQYVRRGSFNISEIIVIVEELRDHLGWYCADLSTSMTFGTHVDQTILNSFFESAKAGGHWGRHNRKIQYGRQPILDLVITS